MTHSVSISVLKTMLAWCLACSLNVLTAPLPQTDEQVSDSALGRGIALVKEGEYDVGLAAIDAALRTPGAAGRKADRALGHLYAGVALVAKGQNAPAKLRFRQAIEQNPTLRVAPDQFPPKVTELLEAARAELAQPPVPRPTPELSKRPPAALRLMRSTSGSAGSTRGGRFHVEDPRSAFEVPNDKQLVVSFEWEGASGTYLLESAWKDPTGAVTLQPKVEVKGTGGRVASYWLLALPSSMTPGQWTLEVTQEGRVIGQHAVQIASKKPASESAAVPNLTELRAKVAPSIVLIEKRDAQGKRFAAGLGFFVKDDLVATAFQVIDGASSLRVVLRDERSFVVEEVTASNRWQDWALLRVPAGPQPALPLAQVPDAGVDCYLADVDSTGNLTLRRWWASTGVSQAKGGARLKLRPSQDGEAARLPSVVEREALGGPLLTVRGEAVGILGGAAVPGESTANNRLSIRPALGTPAGLVTMSEGPATALRTLIATGASLEPASKSELERAAFARTVQKRSYRTGKRVQVIEEDARGLPQGIEYRTDWNTVEVEYAVDEGVVEFTRGDVTVNVWALWNPERNRKARLRLRVYDLDGTVVTEPALVKSFQQGVPASSTWPLSVAPMPTGIYRADILDEDKVVWRGFFRLGA